jgi:FAD/FMN-containing dehydrogenase/ferredoxin
MSWKEYLAERARKTASRRKRIYGIDPASRVEDLLIKESHSLSFRETCRLLTYILFKSPQRRLELLWTYITDRDTPVRARRIESLAQDIRPHLSEGCRVVTNYFERRNYSRDLARVPEFLEKMLHRTTPTLVVQPNTERDISSILVYCKSRGLAVFPRGSASFAFGGAVPTRNGIVVDLSPMMDILEVDTNTKTVRVQPGARWADVATHLESHGLVPRTAPTSRFSTVAGWISTGGMGLDSYKYGSVHESVVSVRVARPDGSIDELKGKDETIAELFGTEGQFGILTEITLRVRPVSGHSAAQLLTFDDQDHAFEFIDTLANDDIQPSHVVFFDREYLKKENILFKEHGKSGDPIVPEKDSVLLHFETPENERKFLSSLNGNSNSVTETEIAARYLWADRFFPLKAQRISPGLLGSEVIIPREKISRYIKKVERLARQFRLDPTMEVIVCGKMKSNAENGEPTSRKRGSCSYLLIVSFSCDYTRTIHYVLSLLFIQLLVKMAVHYGGAPYGVGVWNTPFIQSKYGREHLKKLKQRKQRIDPEDILNPNKFFKVRGRFFSIPSLFLRPRIFRLVLAFSHLLAPVLGLIAWLSGPELKNRWNLPPSERNHGEDLLLQSALRCTSCGACISVCPAYHITKDEKVTGRTKLRMAEEMNKGKRLCQEEAHAPFQCLHCGLCEEVCQTRLPLRDCYLVLENWLEARFGSPAETVSNFVEKLDNRREFIKTIFGLDLPEWSPEEKLSRVPIVNKSTDGERS